MVSNAHEQCGAFIDILKNRLYLSDERGQSTFMKVRQFLVYEIRACILSQTINNVNVII